MKRLIVWLSVVLVISMAGVLVARADSPMRHGWHHHGPWGFMARELHLSGTQRSQIKAIWQKERPAVASLVRELAAESKEMDAATAHGNLDESKVQDIAAHQGATIAKLLVEEEKLTSQIYTTVLSADQRTKADKLQERWHSRLDRFADRLQKSDGPSGK
jgi:Spy/CpxP family protein refolding chaperone